MSVNIYWIFYLIIINLASIVATVTDKRSAIRHRKRIPERRLLLLAALGGSPAMLATMRLIRHKTLHRKFMLGLPALLLIQGGLILFILYIGQ